MRRFLLLDRDGTIIVDRGYLDDPDGVALLPGAAEGLRQLQRAGFGLVVVTNQSGVGRGYFTEERLAQIHHRLVDLLARQGVRLDGIYYCPHTPDCTVCRKPAPGLVFQAARELRFVPAEAVVVGDKESDVQLGRRVGAQSFLIASVPVETSADHVVADLLGVAEHLLKTQT